MPDLRHVMALFFLQNSHPYTLHTFIVNCNNYTYNKFILVICVKGCDGMSNCVNPEGSDLGCLNIKSINVVFHCVSSWSDN